MKTSLATLTAGFALLMAVNPANAVLLYRGLSFSNQTPAEQGWLYFRSSVLPIPSAIATNEGTILDTTGTNSNYAGYFRQSPVILERTKGYNVTFRVQIHSESHTAMNRAGFSVIVTSNKLVNEPHPHGIELGFWENNIWVQNVGFTRGENVFYNTKASGQIYNLSVKDGNYQLFANGSARPILKGKLRQYTGFAPPFGYKNPYTTPNLIFMGDNTTSAKAKVTIVSVEAN
ncbi:MAG: hypothetical protein KME32_12185 [Mojavia pulchra JT2-VF2]|jgi:hypothetical protein|uniref:Uncharacterized protein n=1 Tax=Mojavia pulchra JT2-VF2 TaxID=287848 RepID=A0A951UG59_9NOST|nr:hypothetical protein [Mojavia pulchra JT2-VF2]